MPHRQALIHLDRFLKNLDIVRNLAPGSKICQAVKANGYGHGALTIARAAKDWGVYALGVATVQEAAELRAGGISGPLLLYGIAEPADYTLARQLALEVFVCDQHHLEQILRTARPDLPVLGVHLKIDTGMGRIGCHPSQVLKLVKQISTQKDLVLKGLCSHFPVAETNRAFTTQQINDFLAIRTAVIQAGYDPGLCHLANSAGIAHYPESHLDMVRPGIMSYGYPPCPEAVDCPPVQPVMELQSALSFVKQVPAGTAISYGLRWTSPQTTWIGTVPIGYADGLPRLASGSLHFAINGRLYPQVGTICMDQCMIDLGTAQPPSVGTPVSLFGSGTPGTGADTVAEKCRSISYEVLCGISPRVPRIAVN